MKIVYECPDCYAILPYWGAAHNCPDTPDDEAFFEIDDYFYKFLQWVHVNYKLCKVRTKFPVPVDYETEPDSDAPPSP